jgi:hypothetical protein
MIYFVKALLTYSIKDSYLVGFVDVVAFGCIWVLYPLEKVPQVIIVHVDENDGSVNFDGPISPQVK